MLNLAGLCARGALCVALMASPAMALDKLKVGKSGGPMILTLVDLGTEIGVWKEYGLEVESVSFGGEAAAIQALTSNSIDLAFGSGPGLAYPAKGVPATAIAAVSGAPFNMVLTVAVDTKLKSLDDLKGKLIGVTSAGSLTDWMVHEMSRQKGWGPDGINTFPAGASSTSIAALKTGQIDGVVMGAASGYNAQLTKAGKVLTSLGDLVGDFHSNVLYASNKLIADNPDVIQRFVDGWFKIAAFSKANKDITVRVAAKTLGVSEQAASDSYEDEILRMVRDTGKFDAKAVETIRRSLKELGAMEEVPPAEKLYDERFVKNH